MICRAQVIWAEISAEWYVPEALIERYIVLCRRCDWERGTTVTSRLNLKSFERERAHAHTITCLDNSRKMLTQGVGHWKRFCAQKKEPVFDHWQQPSPCPVREVAAVECARVRTH